jgi:membrane-associated protease RseP (regulator of RpoE activity)
MTDEPTNEPTNEPAPEPTTGPTEPVDIPTEPTPVAAAEGPPPWDATTHAAPAAAAMPSERPPRSGVVVPVWAFITVAGLLVFGLGLLGGWAISSHNHDSREAIPSRDLRQLAPFGPQNGAGNGGNADRWANGNGSSNGNGSGNSQNATVYLGVVPKNSTNPAGAEVTEVAPSSPAEHAGLETGDVITAIDAGAVRNSSQLVQRVRAHTSGDKVSVTYTRNGSSKTVAVTLGTRPQIGQIPLPDQTPQSQS